MKLTRILQNGNQIAPQTLDKAVLVRVFDTTTTLDKVLLTKVDSVKNTDNTLNIKQEGTEVTINHLTNVTSNNKPENLLTQINSSGHIVSLERVKPQNIIVNGANYNSYDGNTESNIEFGDDFQIINKQINLCWGNGTT